MMIVAWQRKTIFEILEQLQLRVLTGAHVAAGRCRSTQGSKLKTTYRFSLSQHSP